MNKLKEKLKNKPVTVEDMNELLDLISHINLKLEINSVVTKCIDPSYTKEIELQTGIQSAIEKLKNKINNAS